MSNHQEVAFALENELEAIIATVRHEFARGEDAATKKRMKAKRMPKGLTPPAMAKALLDAMRVRGFDFVQQRSIANPIRSEG